MAELTAASNRKNRGDIPCSGRTAEANPLILLRANFFRENSLLIAVIRCKPRASRAVNARLRHDCRGFISFLVERSTSRLW